MPALALPFRRCQLIFAQSCGARCTTASAWPDGGRRRSRSSRALARPRTRAPARCAGSCSSFRSRGWPTSYSTTGARSRFSCRPSAASSAAKATRRLAWRTCCDHGSSRRATGMRTRCARSTPGWSPPSVTGRTGRCGSSRRPAAGRCCRWGSSPRRRSRSKGRFTRAEAHLIAGALHAPSVVSLGLLKIHTADKSGALEVAEIAKIMLQARAPVRPTPCAVVPRASRPVGGRPDAGARVAVLLRA